MPKHGQFAIIPARMLDDKRVSESDLRLLLILGTYADKNGQCFPKLATLGERMSVTKQAASQRVQRLVNFGYVTITPQENPDGGRGVNIYRIIYDGTLPPEYDRTLTADLDTPSSKHTGEIDTPSNDHTGQIDTPSNPHTGEVDIERPIRTSHRNGESGAKSAPPPDKESPKLPDSPSVVKAKEEIRAILEGQNCGANPALADATVDKREYRERVGVAFATVFRHVDERGSPDPSQNDKSAAGKLFDLHFPIARSLQFLEYAANGGGERYRTGTTKEGKALTAYHVIGDMDDWRKSGYPTFEHELTGAAAWDALPRFKADTT